MHTLVVVVCLYIECILATVIATIYLKRKAHTPKPPRVLVCDWYIYHHQPSSPLSLSPFYSICIFFIVYRLLWFFFYQIEKQAILGVSEWIEFGTCLKLKRLMNRPCLVSASDRQPVSVIRIRNKLFANRKIAANENLPFSTSKHRRDLEEKEKIKIITTIRQINKPTINIYDDDTITLVT